ncbi:MAG: glycine/betaine ABC transporter [Candidatus Entotheonella factor]|uniref:Glycine/betaine ABC transporter n=2 Tax=Candidatus Entotheonella TaxID=93171 RepID=W4LZE8_ENTF1|nr:MAG: glycine/betaine ABC transporter [Candidatus Entotheonella factor]
MNASSPAPIPEGENRSELVAAFVGAGARYYERQFTRIGGKSGFAWTFNGVAALLGPIWYGMRGLWHWGLPLTILEVFAIVQVARGLWGNLAADLHERIAQIEATLKLRREQLEAAIANQADNVDVFKRTIASLEAGITEIYQDAQQVEASGIWVAGFGLGLLVLVKLAAGGIANPVLERRYSEWLSDRTVVSGLHPARTLVSAAFVLLVYVASVLHYCFPGTLNVLAEFPTDAAYRLTAIDWIKRFFSFATLNGEWFFDLITLGIRAILDGLELLFVQTPWMVMASFILLLTYLSAGARAAIYAGAFLAYMGLLGFWVKAMTTLALLGTAACISIVIGLPLGMFCARRPRLYALIRPIMDFMQTMPAFVFMIPVIAFFGTGKPAAIVTTMIFGGTPVVRLTVLGLQGVPAHIREAAIAYGASRWYLLTKVDLPLAAPSILAGINQTIMLSLAMVVVASLIGAKGLGEDVLEALQYASVGQGILAGFAILFCAMILDRAIQGGNR